MDANLYSREEKATESTIKKLLLAGIGAMAYTYEKATLAVDEMVKKGELTVAQGRELNEELKRVRTGDGGDGTPSPEALRKMLAGLDLATRGDIAALEERIRRLESSPQ